MKNLTMIFLLIVIAGSFTTAQNGRTQDVSPYLLDNKIKQNDPIPNFIWDVQANYNASAVTGAGGNAAVVYLPTVGEFWTSRWASDLLHRWTANGNLIEEFSISGVTGVRALTFDGQYLYAGQNTNSIVKIDPVSKTAVGTITAPQNVRYLSYDPTADGGGGGLWIGNFSTDPQLISMNGTLLNSLSYSDLGTTSIYGAAFDNYSPGGPFLWFWGQGGGAGTPQFITQVSVATGLPTGNHHDVLTDVGFGDTTALAGGLFISTGIVPNYASLGGMLQGTPDRLFAYELAPTNPPSLVTVFEDHFESGTTKWDITNDGGTCVWSIFTPPYPSSYTMPNISGGVLAADADNCGTGSTLLSTATLANPINVSTYQTVKLNFDSDFKTLISDDKGFVDVSINGGATWVNVLTYDGVDAANVHESLDISSIAGSQSNLLVRFKSVQPGFHWYWAIDNVVISAQSVSTSSLNVTSPNGGENWQAGSSKNITWSSTGISDVKLEYTTDNGANWLTIVASTPASNGSYSWIVPNTASTQCLVRISDVSNPSVYDESNNIFTISIPQSITLNSPNGGEDWEEGSIHNITWTRVNVTNVKLEYSTNNGSSWIVIIASTSAGGSGSYSWTIPNTPSTQCKVRISDVSNSSVKDVSDNTFTISQSIIQTVQLTNPSGNELWKVFSLQTIRWTSSGISNVDLYYSTNNGTDWTVIDNDIPAADGSSLWSVPFTPSNVCKVKVVSADNQSVSAQLSGTFTIFDYLPTVTLSTNINFSGTASSSYRMIGLPGDVNIAVGNLLSGDHKTDWNVYHDNGVISQNTSDYLVEYDGGSLFHFKPGKAFWILSRNEIQISDQASSVEIDVDNNYSVPLQNNWNLITNPFNRSVLWSKVVAENSITQNPILYSFNGSWNNGTTTMKPYEGYYFYNVQNLSSLKVPYNPNGTLGKENTIAVPFKINENNISLSLFSNGEEKANVKVVIDEESKVNFDEKDYFAAPGIFEEVGLRIFNAKLSTDYKYLFIESRPIEEEGEIFNIKISNPLKNKLVIRHSLSNNRLAGYEVYLINLENNKLFNLRELNEIRLNQFTEVQNFQLAIGNHNFIEALKADLLPKQYELFQNYPNPFNPTTIIRYAVPVNSVVTLKVFDILGNEVKVLVNEVKESGYYEVEFDGSKLSSGVYICTLNANEFISTKKLLLVK